jgi:hypothetical protein
MNIIELLNAASQFQTSQTELEGICHVFYSKLYSQWNVSASSLTNSNDILSTCLTWPSPSMQETLRQPLTLAKLMKALSELAANKSPRPNGVATKFHKALWPIISPEYH